MVLSRDIVRYNEGLAGYAREVCDALLATIEDELPDADNKMWHAHPVWFFDGNPVVGYSTLKTSVQLLFWSGGSFDEPGISAEGKFRAGQVRYTSVDQIDSSDLARWLRKARDIQWNYRDIRRTRGRLVPITDNLTTTD